MKIKVTVSKTIQETQYEPFHVCLEVEREIPTDDKDSLLKAVRGMEMALENELNTITMKRLEALSENTPD